MSDTRRSRSCKISCKIATEEHEFEQIFRLNHRTFAEEIAQHDRKTDGRLIDRFHGQNTYVIALRSRRLVGMLAVRGQRPFSLDDKLANLEMHLPPEVAEEARSPCEVRLLCVASAHRCGRVLPQLIARAAALCRELGHDFVLISGVLSQLHLYWHLGFREFGPCVGAGAALFQPMYLCARDFSLDTSLRQRAPKHPLRLNLRPGPVDLPAPVRAALSRQPVSHREEAFAKYFRAARDDLKLLTGARSVTIALGSGTLANDLVAAQIALWREPGLVLCNGEFGARLLDHAARSNLDFDALHKPWGCAFEAAHIESAFHSLAQKNRAARWLWCVHCETSTGMLNDLSPLKAIAARRNLRLCLDCVSSLGTEPFDLSEVCLASASSGKDLGAPPGLAIVFSRDKVLSSRAVPRYLDLGLYEEAAEHSAVPFTHSSSLVSALLAALQRTKHTTWRTQRLFLAGRLRMQLRSLGFNLVTPEEFATPAVCSVALPPNVPATLVCRQRSCAGNARVPDVGTTRLLFAQPE